MPPQFLHAQTCYDHLAGDMAVQVLQAMRDKAWLVDTGTDYQLTPLGQAELAALGVVLDLAGKGRRPFARGCVDLTQRHPHLAGMLGAALAGCQHHAQGAGGVPPGIGHLNLAM